MKKQIFLLLMSAACATSYAQLSVNSDGQVAIGAIQDSTFVESDSKSNVHIYGTTSESGVKLSLGPGGGTYMGNTGYKNKALELNGETGLYLKAGVFQTTPLAYYDDYNGGYSFIFNSDIASLGFDTVSDRRMKKDIKDLGSTLDDISQLSGVSFKYINDGSFQSLARADDRTRFGVIAQDVEKVYPELVSTDKDGYKKVDYIGLIPVLLNAVNELQGKLASLEAELQGKTPQEAAQEAEAAKTAKLYQNTPNPFTSTSEIRYELPRNATDAAIYIFDMQGTPVKRFALTECGSGSVTVGSSELKAGIYAYSLIVDGKEVDNRRMILTK